MRTVLAIAVALVIAAAVAVFMVQKGPNLPDLSESDYGGTYHLVVSRDAGVLFPSRLVRIDFTTKTRVKVKHPAGQAEGSARTDKRRLIISIDTVDGLPVAEWSKKWPAMRSKLLAERVAVARRPTQRLAREEIPRGALKILRGVRDEQQAMRALEESDYGASLLNPFDQTWEWKIPADSDWVHLTPVTPEMR